MKRKFKAVFTILLVLTAIIPVLAYKHNISYQRHVQELREEYAKIGLTLMFRPGISGEWVLLWFS